MGHYFQVFTGDAINWDIVGVGICSSRLIDPGLQSLDAPLSGGCYIRVLLKLSSSLNLEYRRYQGASVSDSLPKFPKVRT